MPSGHGLIDLIGPLLGCRIEHAFVTGTACADLLAAEHRDQVGCAEVAGPSPILEAEAVNRRVEAGVAARSGVLARAIRKAVDIGRFASTTFFAVGEYRLLSWRHNHG